MKLFGFRKGEEDEGEKPRVYYGVKYVGGHVLYPEWFDAFIVLWNHQLEVKDDYHDEAIMVFPYEKMKSIANMDEAKISAGRVIALGIIGALWKKNHIYTVLEGYEEMEGMDVTIVLDFHNKITDAQRDIYDRMESAKRSRLVKTSNQQQSNEQIRNRESKKNKDDAYKSELHETIQDVGSRANTLTCSKCAKTNPSNSNFCNYCGSPFSLSCPTCGHTNPYGGLFCGKCGSKLGG